MNHTVDKNGIIVRVGSKVRVLEINPSMLFQVNDDEKQNVNTMKGEVFSVYEIDEYRQAWVEK